jgi:hypothetical protein
VVFTYYYLHPCENKKPVKLRLVAEWRRIDFHYLLFLQVADIFVEFHKRTNAFQLFVRMQNYQNTTNLAGSF